MLRLEDQIYRSGEQASAHLCDASAKTILSKKCLSRFTSSVCKPLVINKSACQGCLAVQNTSLGKMISNDTHPTFFSAISLSAFNVLRICLSQEI